MGELTLRMHFCRVDKYGKLRFTHLDDSFEKLDEHVRKMLGRDPSQWARMDGSKYEGPMLPYDARKCKAVKRGGRASGQLNHAINDAIGLDCRVTVDVSLNSFISKLEANKGERIEAVIMTIVDIRPAL